MQKIQNVVINLDKKVFFIAVGLIILALACFLAYWFFFKGYFLTEKWDSVLQKNGFNDDVIKVTEEKDLGGGIKSIKVIHSPKGSDPSIERESIFYVDSTTGLTYLVATTDLPSRQITGVEKIE
jgi:hypothetical protein